MQIAWTHKLSFQLQHKKKLRQRIESIRQVYALPNRFGLYLAFTLFGSVALAIRLQNNILLLIVVILMVIFFLSMIWSAENLIGVSCQVQKKICFANTLNSIFIHIHKPHGAMDIDFIYNKVTTKIDTSKKINIKVFLHQRGREVVSPMILQSGFPFGIIRAWVALTAGEVIVAPSPAPLIEVRQYLDVMNTLINHHLDRDQGDSVDHYRDALTSDPISRIDWKIFALKGKKLTKVSHKDKRHDHTILDYASLQKLGKEKALSVLCAALIYCEANHIPWELKLPKKNIHHQSSNAIYQAYESLALA